MADDEQSAPSAKDRTSRDRQEPAAGWVDIKKLKAWDKNPRRNDGKPVAAIVESIKRFGFASPIIARKAAGEIIAGHTRLKAAIELGLSKVPVRYIDLDPADAHLLALTDNRVGEFAEWDVPMLQEAMGEFSLPDIEIAGWDSADLDKMAADLVPSGENNAADEWQGMPEFEQPDATSFRSISVHFQNQEGVDAFSRLVGPGVAMGNEGISDKTKFIWFPEFKLAETDSRSYQDDGDA